MTDGTTISFVTRVAGPRKFLAAADRYESTISTSQTTITSVARDGSSAAGLIVAYAGDNEAPVVVPGTTSIDAATNTVTASYSLAALNAGEQQAYGPGAASFAPETLVTNAYSRTFQGTNPDIIDPATPLYPFLGFTIGG